MSQFVTLNFLNETRTIGATNFRLDRVVMINENQPGPNPDDCVIPHLAEPEALERYLLKQAPFDGSLVRGAIGVATLS